MTEHRRHPTYTPVVIAKRRKIKTDGTKFVQKPLKNGSLSCRKPKDLRKQQVLSYKITGTPHAHVTLIQHLEMSTMLVHNHHPAFGRGEYISVFYLNPSTIPGLISHDWRIHFGKNGLFIGRCHQIIKGTSLDLHIGFKNRLRSQ
ncbi:unknown [Bacteroides sp. CAG:927]|nr:unknown [Bacteroides sp. CAG:927]